MMEEYSRNPSHKLLKDIQEAKKHIPQVQGQLFKATGVTQVNYLPQMNCVGIYWQWSTSNIPTVFA